MPDFTSKTKTQETPRIAVIGDYNDNFRPHAATNEAIEHSIRELGAALLWEWVGTDSIENRYEDITATYSGFWIAPGSPYKNMSAALRIIKFARGNNIPVIGTCGGFQHMVIEFARNVLDIKDAEHAEYDPYASKLVVNPLSCSLAGQVLEIEITDPDTITYKAFGTDRVREKYYCNFGLNPTYQEQLHTNGFKVVGKDGTNEARILELDKHPFFIATLFVPQDNSTADKPHKLVTAFLKSVINISAGD